jgi:predicted small secreted protein
MIRKLITVFALGTGLALAGCNTIEGAGEDVESVGDAVEDCAEGVDC